MDDYPIIESAAADTTSGPSLSLPAAKRGRLSSEHMASDSGFMFPQPGLVDKPGQRASGTGSIMHPSGRVLPLGIAQPIQSQELEQKGSLADWDSKSDLKLSWGEGEEEGCGASQQTAGYEQSSSDSGGVEEEAMVQTVMRQLESDSSSSESDSDSSSSDDEAGYDGRKDGMESGQQQYEQHNRTEASGLPHLAKSSERGGMAELVRKSSSASIIPSRAPSGIPVGKKHHVFLSHSTGDQQAVKEAIIIPLRDPSHNIQVVACYHCMPDGHSYNDRYIERAMKESCVIVVALSPSYLDSQRCQKEWQHAVKLLGEEGRCQVVVAAVGKCSRPEPLKSFLYLDFIDKSKQQAVVEKLVQTIGTVVDSLISSPEESGNEEKQKMEGSHGDRKDSSLRAPAASQNDNRDFPSAGGSYEGLGMSEQHQRRMEEEFEAEFQAYDLEEAWGGGHQLESSDRELLTMGTSDPRMGETAAARDDQQQAPSESGKHQQKKARGGTEDDDMEEGEVSDSSSDGNNAESVQSKKVAQFYNELAKPDADKRNESPIFYMRNFNNWVKSVLLRTYLPPRATVLDLCCGKGGDLLKWKEGNIDYLVCADISESSVEACQGRYNSPRMADRITGEPPFPAEFHVADCCEVRLRDRYRNPGCRFHMVSCQFSVHYAFESYSRAHMMLRNACENLRPGGYFIGTTVDSSELIRRLRETNNREEGGWCIGNEVFSVTLDPSLDPWEPLPLFGAKYNFKLYGVVNLPEFLVHFPLFVSMLKDFDMELILQQNFYNFFSEQRHKPPNVHLMFKMQAFDRQTATMPQSLWEAIGLYLVFVFQKRHKTMDPPS